MTEQTQSPNRWNRKHKSLLVRALYLKDLVLLYYCGTVSTKRNTRDFARCRCVACVVPSAFPFFGWFAIHLQSTEKLTLGQPKEGNASPLPKHLSDAPQYLSSRSPAPQGSYDNRSRCFCLLALHSVPSLRASPLTQNLRAARSAAQSMLHHGHSSLSNIPFHRMYRQPVCLTQPRCSRIFRCSRQPQNSAGNLAPPRLTSTFRSERRNHSYGVLCRRRRRRRNGVYLSGQDLRTRLMPSQMQPQGVWGLGNRLGEQLSCFPISQHRVLQSQYQGHSFFVPVSPFISTFIVHHNYRLS
jgi:hypothetical protein